MGIINNYKKLNKWNLVGNIKTRQIQAHIRFNKEIFISNKFINSYFRKVGQPNPTKHHVNILDKPQPSPINSSNSHKQIKFTKD